MIKLSDIKSNPNNPRVIKDDKFKKLVKSIKDFPKMMELRPMVVKHQLKRKCYGMELDPQYCDVIVKRMIKLDDTLTVKRNGEDVTNQFK